MRPDPLSAAPGRLTWTAPRWRSAPSACKWSHAASARSTPGMGSPASRSATSQGSRLPRAEVSCSPAGRPARRSRSRSRPTGESRRRRTRSASTANERAGQPCQAPRRHRTASTSSTLVVRARSANGRPSRRGAAGPVRRWSGARRWASSGIVLVAVAVTTPLGQAPVDASITGTRGSSSWARQPVEQGPCRGSSSRVEEAGPRWPPSRPATTPARSPRPSYRPRPPRRSRGTALSAEPGVVPRSLRRRPPACGAEQVPCPRPIRTGGGAKVRRPHLGVVPGQPRTARPLADAAQVEVLTLQAVEQRRRRDQGNTSSPPAGRTPRQSRRPTDPG